MAAGPVCVSAFKGLWHGLKPQSRSPKTKGGRKGKEGCWRDTNTPCYFHIWGSPDLNRLTLPSFIITPASPMAKIGCHEEGRDTSHFWHRFAAQISSHIRLLLLLVLIQGKETLHFQAAQVAPDLDLLGFMTWRAPAAWDNLLFVTILT